MHNVIDHVMMQFASVNWKMQRKSIELFYRINLMWRFSYHSDFICIASKSFSNPTPTIDSWVIQRSYSEYHELTNNFFLFSFIIKWHQRAIMWYHSSMKFRICQHQHHSFHNTMKSIRNNFVTETIVQLIVDQIACARIKLIFHWMLSLKLYWLMKVRLLASFLC